MRNKQTQKKPKQAVKTVKPKQTRNTPFGDTGNIIGKAVGSMFGGSKAGANIGRFLGSGIGSIFGSGDYQMVGQSPEYNIFTNANQLPKFSTTAATNVVCHREYIGDVYGTTLFANVGYSLNPGVSTTFPWLSTIAQNYQEYRFHGLVFEFRPLITDYVTSGAPGVVVMSTNYNADVTNYTSKQQMENSEFATSVKPTVGLMHGVECATGVTINPQKYIRQGSVPVGQDLRLYDLGNFQFATQANPVQDLGELWVTYCCELFKPIVPIDVGGDVSSAKIGRLGSISGTAPLGLIQATNTGSLTVTTTSSTVLFSADPQQLYYYNILWSGASTLWTAPVVTLTNAVFLQYFNNDGTGNFNTPQTGTAAVTSCSVQGYIKCTSLNPSNITISLGITGSYPPGFVDITVTEIDNGVTA